MNVIVPGGGRNLQRMAWAVTLLVVLVSAVSAGEPEPPLAPSPESATAGVQPATFVAPAAEPRRGGLALNVDSQDAAPAATGSGTRPALRQPLPDWRVLAAVAAAFAVLAAVRARGGRGRGRLPSDVFEVLGEAGLGGGQAVRIVRFGPKTLLVGISSAGPRTLAEIGDPQSTESIVAACRGVRAPLRGPARSTAADRGRSTPAAPPGEAA